MEWIFTEPPKDRKVLAYIDFCGQKRINVIKWCNLHNIWITDMQLNHINPPLCWMELPDAPNGV